MGVALRFCAIGVPPAHSQMVVLNAPVPPSFDRKKEKGSLAYAALPLFDPCGTHVYIA